MIQATRHTIIIAPVELPAREVLTAVSEQVGVVFGVTTDVLPVLEDIAFAYDPNRNQYNSTAVIDKLATVSPPHALKILAVTKHDLFIPILTYVYGEAQLGGRAAVVSIARLTEGLSPLDPDASFAARLAKEAIHELGHTFNLRHCQDPTCIMHYCRCIEDVDNKSDQLCRYCRILLNDEKKRL